MDQREKQLAHAIIATITYYDVLEYPLSAYEVWRHLICVDDAARAERWTLGAVQGMLTSQQIAQYVAEQNGFYTLPGRTNLVQERRRRERISIPKIQRLMRVVRVLRFVPFVRMVALTGRLSYQNGTTQSDLDVLIALADRHIWTGRVLVTLLTQIMGVRRYGTHQSDRVCLNYYISDAHLTVPTQDLFAAHEYSVIVPLYGHSVFEQFVRANHAWMTYYKPHHLQDVPRSYWTISDHMCARFVRRVGEWLLGAQVLEGALRTRQQRKINANPNTALLGACIIADDRHLVFLPRPHGPEVFEEYHKRLRALGVTLP